MDGLKLRPYFVCDGVPSMRDSDVAAFFDRMQADGTLDQINYEGHVPDAAALIRIAKTALFFAVVWVDGVAVALVWLNRRGPRRAHLHFCMFSNGWGADSTQIGAEVLRRLLAIQHHDGEYGLDMIWGVAPAANARAVAYVQRCGGRLVGRVPNYVWNAARVCSEDGMMFYITRNETEAREAG